MSREEGMTPTKAIKAECCICKNDNRFTCISAICKLNDLSLTSLNRIKAYCISCVPEQNLKCVRECTGKLLDGRTCPLHPYRLGHNPKRQGIGNKNFTLKIPTHDTFSGLNFTY